MDRNRLIREIAQKGLSVDGKALTVTKELGRGGNGVAFSCEGSSGTPVVAKIYIPPDSRDLDERSLARFEREVKLSSTLRHPNVIRALASGAIKVGAYSLPFYTMPLAPKTLRDYVQHWTDTGSLNRVFRIFLRLSRGVLFLHSNGVVHRDLKPENVLIGSDGTPWVADLGIAHVNPEFVSGSLKTIERERLLNRDYYAPEQRFGKASEVDERADIYALGCIIYELLLGTPPVRNNSPELRSKNDALQYLETTIDRMTAYAASDRYQRLEDALEDIAINFGLVLAHLDGGSQIVSRDLPLMIKLLKSSNEMQRRKGIDLARELGITALDSLHELLGHGRRDVRNAAALALGEIGHENSVKFLIGAMYGSGSNRAASFRPSADSASVALSRYAVEVRSKACGEINQFVRPYQVKHLIEGMPIEQAYDLVVSLKDRGVLLLDWVETELELLIAIDESRTWPMIESLIERSENFKLRGVLKHLSPSRQAECLRLWLPRLQDPWFFREIFDSARLLKENVHRRTALVSLWGSLDKSRRFDGKDDMMKQIRSELEKMDEQAEMFSPER